MRGVFMAIAVLVYSTCVKEGSTRLQKQTGTNTWLSTSVRMVSDILEQLRLRCVYIIDNRDLALDLNEQQMVLQFWKFLSRCEKKAAYSGPAILDRKPRCGYNSPLYVILSADNSTIRCAQERRFLSEGIWILFLNTTKEEGFEAVNVPFNSLVFVATQIERRKFLLEEVYRVAPHLPMLTRRVGTWHSAVGFPTWAREATRTGDLRGLTIKAAMTNNPPFTVVEISNNGTLFIGGLFGKVWKILEKQLGFNTEWFTPHNASWDEDKANGTEILQLIARKQVDAVVSDNTVTPSRADIVTFTVPLLTYRFSIFIRARENKDLDWRTYLKPFSFELWLAVAAAIPIFAILLSAPHYFGRTAQNEEADGREAHFAFYNSIFYVFGAFCQQGADVTPKTLYARMVYCLSSLSATVVLAAYSAILISFITNQQDTIPFEDLDGILQSGTYKFGALQDSTELTFFSDAKPNTSFSRMYSEIMIKDPKGFPKTHRDGFQRVCEEDYAYMAPMVYVRSIAEAANCALVRLPAQYFQMHLAIALSNTSEYNNIINHNLRSIINTGVLEKLKADTWLLSSSKSKPRLISVGIKHIVPLLAVVLIGIAMASVLLVLELKEGASIKVFSYLHPDRRLRKKRRGVFTGKAPLIKLRFGSSTTQDSNIATYTDAIRFLSAHVLHVTQHNCFREDFLKGEMVGCLGYRACCK